jgi:hypothetical protein
MGFGPVRHARMTSRDNGKQVCHPQLFRGSVSSGDERIYHRSPPIFRPWLETRRLNDRQVSHLLHFPAQDRSSSIPDANDRECSSNAPEPSSHFRNRGRIKLGMNVPAVDFSCSAHQFSMLYRTRMARAKACARFSSLLSPIRFCHRGQSRARRDRDRRAKLTPVVLAFASPAPCQRRVARRSLYSMVGNSSRASTPQKPRRIETDV